MKYSKYCPMPSYNCSMENIGPCRASRIYEFRDNWSVTLSPWNYNSRVEGGVRTVGDYIIKYDGRKEICRTMPYSKIRPRSIHNSDTVLIPGSQLIQIWWIVHPEISSFALCKFFVGFRYSTRLFFYTVGMTVRCRITLCAHR
jgi:hypothetical protein